MAQKDHYIQEAYLRQFTNKKSQVGVYQKDASTVKFFWTNPNNIMVKNNGDLNNSFRNPAKLRKELLPHIEKHFIAAIKRLESSTASLKDKYIIASNISRMVTFSPARIRCYQEFYKDEDLYEIAMKDDCFQRFCVEKCGASEEEATNMTHSLQNGEIKLKYSSSYRSWLEARFKTEINKYLMIEYSRLPWSVIKNDTVIPFITSDNPAIYVESPRLFMQNTFVPLSPSLGVLIHTCIADCYDNSGRGDSFVTINAEDVKKLNTEIIAQAEKYIVSTVESEDIKEIVTRCADMRLLFSKN